jgi:pilus assembly protein FimV
LTSHNRFWRKSAAPVAAALIGLGAHNTYALSLGKVKVQSALGQSLVAEIDISDLSEEDSKSLKPAMASPAAFAGMGLEYNAALNGVQIALQRRPDGNRYLKLLSTRPLNDPFVDLVVELSWASGRIVRTYTILLDPPKTQESASPTVLPAPSVEAAAPQSPASSPAVVAPVSVAAPSAPAVPTAPNQAVSKAASAPIAASAPAVAGVAERKRIRVGKGDTASKLARSMVPGGVSADQMLVALLNANPSAFIGGNINRLRAGVELSVPDASVVAKTSPSEARQIIEGQNQAFQNMRRSLAKQVPVLNAPTKPQEAAGTLVKPPVSSASQGVPSDTLTLSKEAGQSKADKDSMEQIAKQRAKKEATERAAELAKNIEELNQLAKVAAKPGAAASPAAAAVASASEPALAAGAGKDTAAPPATTAPTLPVAPVKPKEPAPAYVDLVDEALQNPGIWATLVALLGLGGYGVYRRMRGSKSSSGQARKDGIAQWESSANTSFATVGGQRVDTADTNTAGLATMVFPESQLEMVNELDPVAEAEVYLAYGKDVPAEEILKEGLQQDPARVAIHLKLLGIYAKRQDTFSFEAMAKEVASLVDSDSTEWTQVQEMGKSIDASNPLYNQAPAGSPAGESSVGEPSIFSMDAQSLSALSVRSDTPAANARPGTQGAPGIGAYAKAPNQAVAPSGGDMDFDVASIALNPSAAAMPTTAAQNTDRLDATLALAEQFMAIDEKEGARALLEEVIADGSDSLRQRAKALLAQIK